MTQDETIRMAKEAGFEVVDGELRLYFDGSKALLKPNYIGTVVDWLKTFAALVAAHEREKQAEQEPVTSVLPCPFCGDNKPTVFEGSTFRWRVAVCNNCGAYAPEVRHDTLAEDQKQAGIESDAAAITAWNTRAATVRTKDLTEQEIQDAIINISPTGTGYFLRIARAIIAADREKNK